MNFSNFGGMLTRLALTLAIALAVYVLIFGTFW
jgi:hypothetical protein